MKDCQSESDCQNRYRLPDGSQGLATCASRQGNSVVSESERTTPSPRGKQIFLIL